MSTLFTDVKSSCCESEVKNTGRRGASAWSSSTETGEARGFQEARGKKRLTRAVSECIQTTKNLRTRQGSLLKSKAEPVSAQQSQDQCRPQLCFTSSFSLRFPSARRNDNKANIRVATKLIGNEEQAKSDTGIKVDGLQLPEQFGEKGFLINILRESGEAATAENASETKPADGLRSWGVHVKHDTSSHRSSDGIQHSLILRDQGQPAEKSTQGQSARFGRVTDLRFTKKETVEGQSGVNYPLGKNAERKLARNNLILFTEGTGSKANSDCQICGCSPKAVNQTLSLPSFPCSYCSNNLKSDRISSTAAMFTSTLVSVLAPHWTGRLRRHKRGFSDVGPDIAQNMNLSAVSQNEQQQRLPLQQIQAQGERVNDFSNKFKGSAETSRSSVERQNESLSHLSESKKEILKTSFLRMNRHEVNQTTGFGPNANPVSVDFGEGPRSTMSLQHSDYRRTARPAEQGDSFSSLRSRPTTSTLLLSSRRLNSRKPSSESFQMQKQLSASISSLHLPSKSVLRVSQPQLNLVSRSDLSKETPVAKPFLASSEQLSNTHKLRLSSSEWDEIDSSIKQRYVITGEFDRINTNPNDSTRERLFSNYLTRFNQLENLKSVQDHRPIVWSISDNKKSQDTNAKIPERSAWNSPNSLTPTDQNHIQNSNGSGKPLSSPVTSVRMKTFTESLSFSPRTDSFVEGTSQSQLWSTYLNSNARLDESNQSPLDQPSPLTSSEFKSRIVCTPSIYKYLRETSPSKSTQASPAFSSPSSQTFSSKHIQEEDKNSRNLRFTFDMISIESRDPLLKADTKFSAPQSLPADTARSVPRISKSPYSTLISTRAAVNSLSSPPVSLQHRGSPSYSISPVDATSPKFGKRSYTSVLRDRLSQRTSSVGGTIDTEKTHSLCQDGASKSMADAKISDYQTNSLIPDTTHRKQTDANGKTISHEALSGIFLSQVAGNNTYATDSRNSKDLSLPLGPSPVGEVVEKEEVTENLQTKGTFQASQSLNSKRSFFSLRSKKDNAVKSSPSSDKEGSTDKKGKITGFKTTNKMLNRLKLTFGGSFLEDSDTTSRRKTKKEEFPNGKVYESIQKEKERDGMLILESKAYERTQTPNQTGDLTVRMQTKPENLSDLKVPGRNQVPDQNDVLTVKGHSEPEKVSYIKGPQRCQKPGQADDVELRTQTTLEKVSDLSDPGPSQKLDQTVDLTARTKAENGILLDIVPLEPRNASPTSTNFKMIESCTLSSPTLGCRREKQDNLPNMERHKRVMRESRSLLLGRPLSPNWPQPDINCYATLPPGKKSRLGPSPTLSPLEFSSEGQNDGVFFNNIPTKRESTSPGEPENVAQTDNMEKPLGLNSAGVVLSSSCADLKYGLQRKRSVSVSSVVSGRPSGPGRISTGSRQSSVSDLSSLDGFVIKSRHSSGNHPVGSPEDDVMPSFSHISYKGPTGRLTPDGHLRSPDNLEASLFSWDMETDPTPPHSPPHTRRMSQIPSPSSASSRASPESLSPRGFLPSRTYKSTLSAFEESGSETTTDDEYYLNSDDEDDKETEL